MHRKDASTIARLALMLSVSGVSLPAGVLSAQTPALRSLSGRATSDTAGKGLANVEIIVSSLGRSVRTDSTGAYRLDLPPGRYQVIARHVGYQIAANTVLVPAAGDARLDFVLVRSVISLDTVVSEAHENKYISPGLSGFEERMHAHQGGYFVDDSVLRRDESHHLSDILASRVNGMRFWRPASSPIYAFDAALAYSTRMTGSRTGGQCGVFQKCLGPNGRPVSPPTVPDLCYVSVYVDGALRYDSSRMHSEAPPDLDDIAVTNLGGVEFYPGPASTPAEYGSSPCGTLILWTREK